jgi:CrcB protein
LSTSYLSQLGLVGLGGFVGSALRFAIAGLVHRALPQAMLPVGTAVVNISGCLLIGLLTGLADLRQMLGPEARLVILIGVLGGFTTFSTLAYESFALAQDSEYARALANMAIHVVVGFAAVWLGYVGARYL